MVETTHQLHYAAQLVAIANNYLLPAKPDDSHTNMEWLHQQQVMAGQSINRKLRVALHPASLTLIVYGPGLNEVSRLALEGVTKADALDWLKAQVTALGVDGKALQPAMHYEMPSHAIANGAPFERVHPEQFQEMANYRSNGDLILKYYAAKFGTARPVRIWPHHFDNGSYIPVEFDGKGGALKSFSIGKAVADPYANEPYFYVTTWSALDNIDYSQRTDLSVGEWNTKDWTGAVLRASDIVATTGTREQITLINEFLTEAINASIQLLNTNEVSLL